jgi:hypothetical protein
MILCPVGSCRQGEQDMAWDRSKSTAVLLDFVERAAWSAAQVFFATLLGGGAVVAGGNLPWRYGLTLAGSAAVSSLVLTAIQYLARWTDLPFWLDVLVRLAKTFLGSLAAAFAAANVFDVTTFHWTTALNVAFLATISALGKGLLARGQPAAAPPVGGQAAVPRPRTSPSTLAIGTYLQAVQR